MTEEERAAEAEADRAAVEALRAKQSLLPKPEPDPDDPRLDWRNYDDKGYTPPTAEPVRPERVEGRALAPPLNGGEEHSLTGGQASTAGDHVEQGGGVEDFEPAETVAESPKPGRTHKPRKPYKKRQPKPPFIPLALAPAEAGEARKAQAVAEVEAERREAAAAEAERRKARARARRA